MIPPAKMGELGYQAKGKNGILLRRFFIKENQFHIHVFEQNDPEIERHLKFRDWMRKNPHDKQAEDLKRKLAKRYSNDRAVYTVAKNNFLSDIDTKADVDSKKQFYKKII